MSRSLKSRYRGALLGALLGDCIGQAFEGALKVSFERLESHVLQVQSANLPGSYEYTDDSAMTGALSDALLSSRSSRADLYKHIGHLFAVEFKKQPDRGYGMAASELLPKLHMDVCEDPFHEASLLFNGGGSYGNGAAMRVSPVALFATNMEQCIELAENQGKLTHSNPLGWLGGVFQALAVKLILDMSADEEKLKDKYLNELSSAMKQVEDRLKKGGDEDNASDHFYSSIIEVIKRYLDLYENQTLDTTQMTVLRSELGNEIAAHRSVPLSLFLFLFTLNKKLTIEHPESGPQELPPFCNAIFHAILFGGDTDTIASMCGAIAGAFYSSDEDQIPASWIAACEDSETFIKRADDIFHLRFPNET